MNSEPFPAVPNARARIDGLDAARVIAAVGTVWVHTMAGSQTLSETAEYGRFSVPYFNMCAGWFLVSHLRRKPQDELGRYAVHRVSRLYVPFLIWSVIYLLGSEIKRTLLHQAPASLPDAGFLLIGHGQQMWYLPFLLLWSIAAFAVVKPSLARRRTQIILGVSLVVLGFAIALLPQPEWFHNLPVPPYFLERKWMRVSSFLWGVGAGLIIADSLRHLRLPRGTAAIGLLFTAACAIAWMSTDHRSLLQNLSGLGLVLFGLGLQPGPVRTALARLGRYGYGIFLSHTLFVDMAHTLAVQRGVANHAAVDVSIWLFAVVASAALTAAVNRSRRTRWLLPL